jgi:MFS family permease
MVRLLAARSLNTFGRAIISSTINFELWERTHSKLVIAAIGGVQVLPVIALFVHAGAFVDRTDRRRVTTAAAATLGGIGLALAMASYYAAPIAVFLAVLAVNGAVTAIHAPASSSLLPLILPREDLERTNRYGATLQELAVIIAPALAGLALAIVIPSAIYAAVAVTGVASAIAYRSLPPPRAVAESAATAARRDWRTGLRFIFRSPLLLPALTLDMFAVLFAGVTSLLSVVSTDVLGMGSMGYGFLRAAQSMGAVLMALVGGRLKPWPRPGRTLLIVVALFGLVTVGFGLSRWFPLSMALLVVMGALDNISVVIRLTLEQMVVPDAIRGRVSAVHYVFIGMSNELGSAESGAAAWLVGTVPAIVAGGAIAVVVVGWVAHRWRAFAQMPPLAQLRPDE